MNIKEEIKKRAPDKFFFTLLHLKKKFSLQNFKALSYSADGEDLLLEKLFRGKKTGLYVDVGAFHPKFFSNTHLLYKQGWHGINIDPNKESINLFKKYRPRDINLALGITEKTETKTYYNFTQSGLNTFDEKHASKKDKSWNKLVNTEEIHCVPLREILQKHLKNEHIDILDVDVEGLDLSVLKSNDWNQFRPSVVLVEDREFREKLVDSEIYAFLKERNYRFHSYNNITLIMVAEEFVK